MMIAEDVNLVTHETIFVKEIVKSFLPVNDLGAIGRIFVSSFLLVYIKPVIQGTFQLKSCPGGMLLPHGFLDAPNFV